ncbi:uncharacterized protein LOC110679357 [Aedes aegypti]|uniref:Uncharacterized protein n=1 Tax=Aedes aegypti TaxID=7159 RepID=A0A6I8U843_AEDAE|nr:uncharacterized protein LOC110679357 [Aedes aegypti]
MNQRSELKVILMGETGAGKSTLVNYFANYFMNGSIQNLKIAIPTKHYQQNIEGLPIHSEKDIRDTTKSQTQKSSVYNFTKNRQQYGIIDTPGLSDNTVGADKDNEHIANIVAAASNTEAIAAIILVINGAVARVTVSLRNAINRLKGVVPDILLNNLIVVLTNCSADKANFDLSVLKPWTFSDDNIFYMNNNALAKSPNYWNKDMKKKNSMINQWNNSMTELAKVVTKINTLGQISSSAFREMRHLTNEITTNLNDCKPIVQMIYNTQKNFIFLQNCRINAIAGILANSNYTIQEQKEIVSLRPTSNWNVICHKCNASTECCPDCKAVSVAFCSKVAGYKCTKCGCSPDSHVLTKFKPIKSYQTVAKIDTNTKKLFDEHTNTLTILGGQIFNLETSLESYKINFITRIHSIKQSCNKLKRICSQMKFTPEQVNAIREIMINARNISNIDDSSDAQARVIYLQTVEETFD